MAVSDLHTWVWSSVTVAALFAGTTVFGLWTETPTAQTGTTAVGTSPDGQFVVRSVVCDGTPTAIEISAGAPGADERTTFATLEPDSEDFRAPFDPTGLSEPTAVSVGSPSTQGVRVSIADWRSVPPGVWLISAGEGTLEVTDLPPC